MKGKQPSGPQHQVNFAASSGQPTCTDSSGTIADAEPLAFGRRLTRADVESSLGRPVCRGTEGGTGGRIRRGKQGPSGPRPQGKDRPAKQMSRPESSRSSDEAIVSDDATGQNNPTPSQGPLDRNVPAIPPLAPTQCGDHEVRRGPALQPAYKPAEPAKVAAEVSGLKPYRGKPAVRNFREV